MDLHVQHLAPESDLAVHSFVASRHPTESCDSNGLPLTPNSISILGQSMRLKSLNHPHLCKFVDCLRGKHERIVTVSEYYKTNMKTKYFGGDLNLVKTCRNVLLALQYLNAQDMVHATLELENVLLDAQNDVKLIHYGMGHLTAYGSYVSFPIFNARFTAPEVISGGFPDSLPQSPITLNGNITDADSLNHILKAPKPLYGKQVDVWSLGMILASCALNIPKFWPNLTIAQVLRKVLSFHNFYGNVLERIAREHNKLESLKDLSEDLKNLIQICLVSNPDERQDATSILKSFFQTEKQPEYENLTIFPSMKLRCSEIDMNHITDELEESPLECLSITETYHMWKLAGGDVFGELRKHGLLITRPAVLTMPKLVMGEGHEEGKKREKCSLFDSFIIILSLDQLKSSLQDITVEDCYPLLMSEEEVTNGTKEDDEMRNLPLIIKEADVRYQFKRIILYRRLLQCYPYLRVKLWQEAQVDTQPLYRSFIWASLLGIDHDTVSRYKAIDKESWSPTDGQIGVDIPRCHQYNSLLSSPEGHRKFKRILKAWVITNQQYVYWQGLDSLCAPFLYLNFNDEALAFSCMSAFIPKYLHGMFQKDNSAVIQEYLAKFSHIQAFHDAELFNHLDDIGFIPDLYSIPWILTMFAHVFPLHNIFHLWDKLLLGDSSFPLCIGLSILYQLRTRLLASEFNDCILLFSDLPAIDIERAVKDSMHFFCTTPKSLTWRKYGNMQNQEMDNREETRMSDLNITSLTLAEQRREKVPRLSGEDLKELLGAKILTGEVDSSKVLILDIRSVEEYKRGTLPTSHHLSLNSAFNENGTLTSNGKEILSLRKGKIVCVVGSKKSAGETYEFGLKLLKQNFNRVCILHGGIEIFNSISQILVVPNA